MRGLGGRGEALGFLAVGFGQGGEGGDLGVEREITSCVKINLGENNGAKHPRQTDKTASPVA